MKTMESALVDFHTRLLYPFYFKPKTIEAASKYLRKYCIIGNTATWQKGDFSGLYEEEILPHVLSFVFPTEPHHKSEYLVLNNDLSNTIFHDGLIVEIASNIKCTVQRTGIELFLNEHGIGILSINLRVIDESITPEQALAVNYRIVQPLKKYSQGLRLPHPETEPDHFVRMPQNLREIPCPAESVPIEERLGQRGGRFSLIEFAVLLLSPLKDLDFRPVIRHDVVQAQFIVYSVARYSQDVDWSEEYYSTKCAPFLSGLAQVEEPTHAGALPGQIGLPNVILNKKHWAAVGLMGAAHLMADQAGDHAFNASRAGRAMSKYFIAYLMALMQRILLQQTISEASLLINTTVQADKLSKLRQSLLEFGVGGHFTQVSSRHSVQRFFTVAEDGLGVNSSWRDIRQAINDLDAKATAEQMMKLAAETKALAEGQKLATEGLLRLQCSVHWIEVFIASVYCAEFWHIFSSHINALHGYIPYGVIFFGVLGFVVAAAILRPWKH